MRYTLLEMPNVSNCKPFLTQACVWTCCCLGVLYEMFSGQMFTRDILLTHAWFPLQCVLAVICSLWLAFLCPVNMVCFGNRDLKSRNIGVFTMYRSFGRSLYVGQWWVIVCVGTETTTTPPLDPVCDNTGYTLYWSVHEHSWVSWNGSNLRCVILVYLLLQLQQNTPRMLQNTTISLLKQRAYRQVSSSTF
jgi:hypothetical protein